MSGLTLRAVKDGVYVLTFDRPKVKNAVNSQVISTLSEHLTFLETRSSLRAVIVTGGGSDFVSGGDLKDLATAHDLASGREFSRAMTENLERLSQLPVPVLAAIEGVALGGGMEIALACDLRVAGRGARLGFRQTRMGLCPGWGGGYRLHQLVGKSKALRLLWESQDLTAESAEGFGLLDWVVDDGTALDFALSWVGELVKKPHLAVTYSKAVLYGASVLTPADARAREQSLFLELWVSDDHDEAVSAFLEKRRPKFRKP